MTQECKISAVTQLSNLRFKKIRWVGWLIPLIPALGGRSREISMGQPGLHSDYQDSQSYVNETLSLRGGWW